MLTRLKGGCVCIQALIGISGPVTLVKLCLDALSPSSQECARQHIKEQVGYSGESLHVYITILARVVKVFMYTSPFSSCPTANSWIGVAAISCTSVSMSDGITDTDDTLRS